MRKPSLKSACSDSISSDFILDPAKCGELSLEEKRELVYSISQWPKGAPEILQSWSRREILQILCAEMGKERKYTGLKKIQIIENLLKLVSDKISSIKSDDMLSISRLSPEKTQNCPKRPKKKEQPLHVTIDTNHFSLGDGKNDQDYNFLCQNLACRATMSPNDAFCKRCSCCICHCYDDNKDPSLWLVCGSDPPNEENSCGLSCHLECAIRHERAGIVKKGHHPSLDGSFYCVSCGKVNGLLGCWRKQLLIAKDARRVDVLCSRISLSHKILKGTKQYKDLHKIVKAIVKKLKKEVGPLERVSAKMARGIVNRLSSGAEVQKLCALAAETVDTLLSHSEPLPLDQNIPTIPCTVAPPCLVQFEDVSPVSIIVALEFDEKLLEEIIGCKLWHRKAAVADYPEDPTCILLRPDTKFIISGLDPSTEYFFKAAPFSCTRVLGEWEARWVTEKPLDNCNEISILSSERVDAAGGDSVSALDEEHETGERASVVQGDSQRGSTNSSDNNPKVGGVNHSKVRSLEEISNNDGSHGLASMEVVPFRCSNLMPSATPSKSDGANERPGLGDHKKSMGTDYEYCVKMVRWLECEGHMEKEFRVKFLTWFSLRATVRERRVVSAFVDTLIDDPASLAAQLVDTFTEGICGAEKPVIRNSFCPRLWH